MVLEILVGLSIVSPVVIAYFLNKKLEEHKIALSEVKSLATTVVDAVTPKNEILRPPVRCSQCGHVVVVYATSNEGVHTCRNCQT